MPFEWDERKRESNLLKHHIDFEDAKRIFESPVFEKAERRRGEDRVLAIGHLEDIAIVVVYVMRGGNRRIISARIAHRNERQEYQERLSQAFSGEDEPEPAA